MNRLFQIFKVREAGNAEFWVSHLIILISTVLGVYLAAQAGYRTAIEFEVSRTDREGYYLRRALLNEVKQNLDWGDKMAQAALKDAQEGGVRFGMERQQPQTFVWETMKQQSATFQLPPETLAAIREYYSSAENHVKTIMPPMTDGGIRIRQANIWLAETKKTREAVMTSLEQDLADLRAELTAKGVKVK